MNGSVFGAPLFLVFDVGTQSIRAALVERDGSFAGLVKERYPQPY